MDPSERIASHMNGHHRIALVDYLAVYAKVPLDVLDQASVKITHVDENHLHISYKVSGSAKIAKISWEAATEPENITVSSLGDIKGKLVSMAKYAAEKQGFSHVQIKDSPRINLFTFLMTTMAILFGIGAYDVQLLKKLFKNDPLTSAISPYFPKALWSALNFVGENGKAVFIAIYAIHIFEGLSITLPKVRQYRVPAPQSVFWVALTFIEGYGTPFRFNKLVASTK